MESNFENEEKVESKVDEAEVIIIKLMTKSTTTPKALPAQYHCYFRRTLLSAIL